MLSELIFEGLLPTDRAAIVTSEGSTSWADLRKRAQFVIKTNSRVGKRRVGLSVGPTADSYAVLAALDRLACDVFLLDSRLAIHEARKIAEKLKLGALLIVGSGGQAAGLEVHEIPNEEKWSGNSTVTILTSGSTGEPKAARHTWESLARPIRKRNMCQAPTWLLTFRPNLYAALQVMLQCFADWGTLAVTNPGMDPQSTAEFMVQNRVLYVSATPSYWRRLLMFCQPDLLNKIQLRQITLGGEVVDQPLLDRLRRHYPEAHLVHIYATTELGRCFSVGDGQAGFPANYLETVLPDGVRLKVHQNELWVKSLNSMRMYDPYSSHQATASDWFPTGDLVEIKGCRVFFVGRRSDMINVAGSKVYPIEVERVIRNIPGVSEVRVYGKVSSIAGELVACEIAAEPGRDANDLKDFIIRACRSQLASYQQPRLIKFVDQIGLSSADKIIRTKTP